jgi:hypothetical protein
MSSNTRTGVARSEIVLTGIAFAVVFVIGIVVFAVFQSVAVAAAALAVCASLVFVGVSWRDRKRAAEAVAQKQADAEPRLRALENSLRNLELKIYGMEANTRQQLDEAIAPITESVLALSAALDRETRFRPSQTPKPPSQEPVAAQHSAMFSDLQRLRAETMIKEALYTGKLSVRGREILAMASGRHSAFLVEASMTEGLSQPLTEATLRELGVAEDVIRQFDRVRFAYAFEIATGLAKKTQGPMILCPLTLETLSHQSGRDIVNALTQRPNVARQILFVIAEEALLTPSGIAREALDLLTGLCAGFGIACETPSVEPALLHSKGVRMVLVPLSALLAARDRLISVEIHPADSVALLARYNIDLVATETDPRRDLAALQAFGINLIARDGEAKPLTIAKTVTPSPPVSAPKPEPPFVVTPTPIRPQHRTETTEPASLRAHLRRLSA